MTLVVENPKEETVLDRMAKQYDVPAEKINGMIREGSIEMGKILKNNPIEYYRRHGFSKKILKPYSANAKKGGLSPEEFAEYLTWMISGPEPVPRMLINVNDMEITKRYFADKQWDFKKFKKLCDETDAFCDYDVTTNTLVILFAVDDGYARRLKELIPEELHNPELGYIVIGDVENLNHYRQRISIKLPNGDLIPRLP